MYIQHLIFSFPFIIQTAHITYLFPHFAWFFFYSFLFSLDDWSFSLRNSCYSQRISVWTKFHLLGFLSLRFGLFSVVDMCWTQCECVCHPIVPLFYCECCFSMLWSCRDKNEHIQNLQTKLLKPLAQTEDARKSVKFGHST